MYDPRQFDVLLRRDPGGGFLSSVRVAPHRGSARPARFTRREPAGREVEQALEDGIPLARRLLGMVLANVVEGDSGQDDRLNLREQAIDVVAQSHFSQAAKALPRDHLDERVLRFLRPAANESHEPRHQLLDELPTIEVRGQEQRFLEELPLEFRAVRVVSLPFVLPEVVGSSSASTYSSSSTVYAFAVARRPRQLRREAVSGEARRGLRPARRCDKAGERGRGDGSAPAGSEVAQRLRDRIGRRPA